MVFSSYLDQANWQQHQQQHQQQHHQQQQQTNYQSETSTGGLSTGHHFHPPPPPPPPPQLNIGGGGGSGGGTSSIRPGSMSDRARMANIPMPEVALKCPRCESTNTKFCYFNNYSLSQPRHFCKTCRRYWTRGGALRSVPVGGGCRRNKRSNNKASSSINNNNKSSPASSNTSGGPNTNYMNIPSISSSGLGQQFLPPPRSMGFSNLHNLNIDHHYGGGGEIGFNNYGGINFPGSNFFLGNSSSNAAGSFLSGMEHQWRMPLQTHQFPFLGANNNHGLDIPSHGMFPVDDQAGGSYGGDVRPKMTAEMNQDHEVGLVKSEMSQDMSMSSSRHFLGNTQGNIEQQQYWTSGTTTTSPAWTTHLSGFSSSSASHHPV